MLTTLTIIVFTSCMLCAAVTDLLSMTIRNRVSMILIASFALIAPLAGMDWSVYAMHWAAGLAVLLVTFALFAMGAMGGGDAKLMSATALWMGLGPALVNYVLVASVLGGVLTLAILLLRASPRFILSGTERLLPHLADKKTGIPYGIALGAAGLLSMTESDLLRWALAPFSG
ncbi:MAG: prepilin peptidase [Methylobacterium mesophilicum]|nr:prepilin peptidase [Methylobacterium mesophilicum]